jgi:hypothetical protein
MSVEQFRSQVSEMIEDGDVKGVVGLVSSQ